VRQYVVVISRILMRAVNKLSSMGTGLTDKRNGIPSGGPVRSVSGRADLYIRRRVRKSIVVRYPVRRRPARDAQAGGSLAR